MENRRHTGTTPGTSFNQNRPYKRPQQQNNQPQDGRSYGERKFQPRTDRFQSRDRDNNNSNNNNSRFQPREDRFRGKDDRFPPRENRFRTGGSGTSNDRERTNDRFQRRDDNRFQGRSGGGSNDRFPPRRNFIPRGKPGDVPPWKQLDKPKVYDEMQVTDGKHRGKFLTSTASPKVRPTARRIREVMFRLIFRRVRAGRFLDLCAGSGAVGIEAISRGALISTFVERSGKMCSFIKKNLEACGIKQGHGEVCELEVVPFLKKMQKRRRFWDVVYFDPPYDTNYDEVLDYLKRGVAIKPGGLLLIEHHAEMFFPEKIGVLRRWRVVTQGDTALSFYERKS
ncbi:MAG TPA: 16S rRNA (guanine(966)-N(2))-methyltransferase RsmD [Pyrinomonadaceae bacterium]|nr:16S rRNA (guanine(966)-N(2))-methyltransferase RsmD [Pyrinomonadaceae bacterium]